MLQLSALLGEIFGNTDNQTGYYSHVFGKLLDFGEFLPSETKGWNKKSTEIYNGKLLRLQIIEMKRKGFRGKIVYKWHPVFYAQVSELWKQIKRRI